MFESGSKLINVGSVNVQIMRNELSSNKGYCYLPDGSPPPCGDKFFQKIEWLRWPPPLNLRAGWRAITVPISPASENQRHVFDKPRFEHKLVLMGQHVSMARPFHGLHAYPSCIMWNGNLYHFFYSASWFDYCFSSGLEGIIKYKRLVFESTEGFKIFSKRKHCLRLVRHFKITG